MIEVASSLLPQALPFALLSLHGHLLGQAIGHQTDLIALSIRCLHPSHDVPGFPIGLPFESRLEINPLPTFCLQSQMAIGRSGDSICVLVEHQLNRAANWVACICHRDVSCS